MKYFKLFCLLSLFTCPVSIAHAQDIALVKGDITVLKGQPTVSVTFVYDGMNIDGLTEEFYLKQKKSEYRKAADGEKFISKWKSDFQEKFEPKFIEQLNFGLKRIKLTAGNDEGSKYTMIVITDMIQPGFYGQGGFNRETYVNLTVNVIESSNPDNILAVIKSERVIGIGINTSEMKDQQCRIANAYGESGAKIAKLITKLCK